MLFVVQPKVLLKYISRMKNVFTNDNCGLYIIEFLKNVVVNYWKYKDSKIPVEYLKIIYRILGKSINDFGKNPVDKWVYCISHTCIAYSEHRDEIDKGAIDALVKAMHNIIGHKCANPVTLYLTRCWSCGVDFVPDDITPRGFIDYLSLHKGYRYGQDFSDELVSSVKKVLEHESINEADESVIKTMLLGEVVVNFNNLKVICWDISKGGITAINNSFNSQYTNNVVNYGLFHEFMSKYYYSKPDIISLDEYIFAYTKKNCRDVPEDKIHVNDYNKYAEFMFTKCDTDELVSKLKSDHLIPTVFGNVSVSLLKFVIDNYIITMVDSRIVNKFISVVMRNNDIIDIIVDKKYMTIHQLTDLLKFSLNTILKTYPNLIKYYDSIPAVVIKDVLTNTPDAIYKYPWDIIPSEYLEKEIMKNGYSKIIPPYNIKNPLILHPANYIDTDKLIDIISTCDGNGIGYCIEYSMSRYIKHVLGAVYTVYKNSI